MIKTWICIETW